MSCDEVRTRLSALLDGELTAEVAAVIEAHLAGCTACSEYRDEMSAVVEMATAWTVDSGDVAASVRQQIMQDEINSALIEIKRLRGEVESLRSEIAVLKSHIGRRGATPGHETSVLRFPYAGAPNVNRTIL